MLGVEVQEIYRRIGEIDPGQEGPAIAIGGYLGAILTAWSQSYGRADSRPTRSDPAACQNRLIEDGRVDASSPGNQSATRAVTAHSGIQSVAVGRNTHR